MPLQPLADQSVNTVVVSTTAAAGTIGTIGLDFGFVATSLTVLNDKTSTVYLSLNSTAGSTGGHPIKAGETITLNLKIAGCSFASTTTSTGDTARVLAVRA